jgi:hypothetical protein
MTFAIANPFPLFTTTGTDMRISMIITMHRRETVRHKF